MFTFIIEKFQCVVNLQFEIVNGVNMVAISIFIFIIYLFIQLVVIFYSSPAFAPSRDARTSWAVSKPIKLKPKGFFLVQIRPGISFAIMGLINR